jgi:uncharacterized RDD family membrane protein YckC
MTSPPLSSDPLSPVASPDRLVGSLWRRVIAFILDSIFVGVLGTVIALPFFDILSRLGAWGRLVGFCIAIAYFGVLNSRIGNGQTIGKRLLHLQVVDASGATISFSKALVRYAVLSAPFFLNGLALPLSRTPKPVLYLNGAIVFGLGAVTIYLILFNRSTRQGAHDLVVGSFVADVNRLGALGTKPIWKWHWAFMCALGVLGLVGGNLLYHKLMKVADFPTLWEDVRLIENIEHVQSAGVFDQTVWNSGKLKRRSYVVNVFWSCDERGEVPVALAEVALANQVAAQILASDPQAKSRDQLQIVMFRGYDLGIAHAVVRDQFVDSPSEWETKISASQ